MINQLFEPMSETRESDEEIEIEEYNFEERLHDFIIDEYDIYVLTYEGKFEDFLKIVANALGETLMQKVSELLDED